ncbi:MAG TPA: orotidine-5'-phosphate decarboxylase [Vicinamibacteria bacterium]|nr:orotidine-5'-phosphate decarboxylase [Vicinamibacteria bacterium]
MKRPQLVVAIDLDRLEDVLRLRDELSDLVDFFKVGKELFTACGPRVLEELSPARIFLDLKYHDIPATVAGAVRAAASHGVDLVDVHAMGGKTMMRAAAEAAASFGKRRPLVLGVTVLTHLVDEELQEVGLGRSSTEQVVRLAQLAAASGLDGVVASAWEIEAVLEATEGRLAILVPGVRPAWASATHDQKRVATPKEAARRGASYVVVGRAITRQQNRREAASRILEELESR